MSTPRTAVLGTTLAAALISGGLVAASMSSGGVAALEVTGQVSPSHFNHPKSNVYYPLKPGTVSRYRGTDEGRHLHERLAITRQTRMIQGVRTTVVHDVLRRADDTLAEETHDWYAADNDGNVWYFGERTATYDRLGHVLSRDGSWQAGVDGAVAGMIMPAHPHPTDAFRQELYVGQAEDQAWIVQRHISTSVPYGHLDEVVRSFEWTRLEPGVMSLKLYAPGLGIVVEKDVAGGNERFELVSVEHH